VPTRALRFRPPDLSDGAVAAVPERPPNARVWLLDASRSPEERAVETGIADDQFTEIVSGLDEGARVITAVKRDPVAPVEGGSPFLPSMPRGKRGR
jgi:multidrug efflux pump subunit AcrA (membrane-fusion protein)